MLIGKPTIVTDDKGPDGYIENGEDGIFIHPNDSVALREAILLLLDNPDKANEMDRKAIDKAILFSAEEHFRRLLYIISDIMKK